MNTITIDKSNVIAAYNGADEKEKKFLKVLFPDVEFDKPKNIMERIKTFEDACEFLNLDHTKVFSDTDSTDEVAYKRLKVIARALNEGWAPDWTNSNEYKYYPWFDASSGFRLSYLGYADGYSHASVGSRLCFKSRELAEYAGKQFADIYTDFFLIQK